MTKWLDRGARLLILILHSCKSSTELLIKLTQDNEVKDTVYKLKTSINNSISEAKTVNVSESITSKLSRILNLLNEIQLILTAAVGSD